MSFCRLAWMLWWGRLGRRHRLASKTSRPPASATKSWSRCNLLPVAGANSPKCANDYKKFDPNIQRWAKMRALGCEKFLPGCCLEKQVNILANLCASGVQSTETNKKAWMWLRQFCSCSCLTALPCLAWVLFSKIYITFCSPLYTVSG